LTRNPVASYPQAWAVHAVVAYPRVHGRPSGFGHLSSPPEQFLHVPGSRFAPSPFSTVTYLAAVLSRTSTSAIFHASASLFQCCKPPDQAVRDNCESHSTTGITAACFGFPTNNRELGENPQERCMSTSIRLAVATAVPVRLVTKVRDALALRFAP